MVEVVPEPVRLTVVLIEVPVVVEVVVEQDPPQDLVVPVVIVGIGMVHLVMMVLKTPVEHVEQVEMVKVPVHGAMKRNHTSASTCGPGPLRSVMQPSASASLMLLRVSPGTRTNRS